jgi:hypothetical protein
MPQLLIQTCWTGRPYGALEGGGFFYKQAAPDGATAAATQAVGNPGAE